MSFLPYPAENTSQAIALIKQDGSILHNVVHGDENAEVLTENGLVPSINKVLNDLLATIGAGTAADVTIRADLAAGTATVARQLANKMLMTFDTVAEMKLNITTNDVGRKVQWMGYHTLSDGGSGWGTVKSGTYTADEGKIIAIGVDLYVEQNIKGFSLNARKYGLRGDGSTSDTTQCQRLLNSGHKNIEFPEGVYILGAITIPDWVSITGVGYQPSVGGGTRITEFRFSITGGTNAITCGSNPVIKNILFINAGGTYNETTKTLSGTTAGCIKLNENAVIEECSFYLWRDVVRTGNSTFYLKTNKVEFNRCTNGYVAEGTSPYNIHIHAPHSSLTENFLVGIGAFTPRSVKIFGGSIEGYTTVATRFLDLSIFGTYFESEPERTVFGAISPDLNESMVTIVGATIFMNRTTRFVNMSGLSNVSLTGQGNTFTGSVSSAATCYYLPASGSISLGGDKIEASITASTTYVDSITKAVELGGITMPHLQSTNPQYAYSGILLTGSRGFVGGVLSAEPSQKVSGQVFLADGGTWDPLTLAAGRPYYVLWQGDRWRALSG